MKLLSCIDPRKTVDCWFCAIVRFIFGASFLLILYYLPEFLRLVRGEDATFRPKLTKMILPILIFSYPLITSIYGDIRNFTKEKKKTTEEKPY